MFQRIAVLCAVVFLAGCGTVPFAPEEYPLRAGLIPAFDVAGPVSVSNNQPSGDPTIVYSYGGTKLSSDLKTITEVMVHQTSEELQKNTHQKGSAAKSIALKVDSLVSEYIVFSWKSKIFFEAKLGDGQAIAFEVHHASGILTQDLNGCIAEGVMHLLNDSRVKAYLAQ
jgi:hypothetical protein